MDNNVEAKVKELVTNFKLEEALDILIVQAQSQTHRKQNALLVLKGKLAMLEEQHLSGILDPVEVARQKASIAHQILDIADGSSLDHELPEPKPEQVLVQKTVNIPTSSSNIGKHLLMGVLLVAGLLAGVFFAKSCGSQTAQTEKNQQVQSNDTAKNDDAGQIRDENQPTQAANDAIKVLEFPNYRKKFNFLDFQFDFQAVKAQAYSDTEIKLIIRYYLTCRSNLGVCYRAIPRVYADDKIIGPTDQLYLAGWVSHDSTIIDELSFVLPNNAKTYLFELSRDGSSWKRQFKLLQ